MDYMQFKKFMEKVDKIEKTVQKVAGVEEMMAKLAKHIEGSMEEMHGTLLRIESIVETYVERKIKDMGSK